MNALNRKKVIKGFCFVLIFLLLFIYFQDLLQAKWIAYKKDTSGPTSSWIEYRGLEPDTVDVFFVGTSHIYSDIDPMYIYETSGITSYALAGPGMRLDLSCMVLEEALKTQKPKVVFLDMSAIQFSDQQTEGRCHKISDQLPISKAKIEYAFDNENEDLKPLDVLFPFFRYHTRWEKLKASDFQYITGDLKETAYRGHYISYQNKPTEYHFYEDKPYVLTDRNLKYMKRFKEICDRAGVDLILFKAPAPQWYESQSKGAEELARMLNVPWLELFYVVDEIGLDVSTDFRDDNDHLNQQGAEKLCDYLVRYIQKNYELRDQRAENQQWNEELILYKEAMKEIAEKK